MYVNTCNARYSVLNDFVKKKNSNINRKKFCTE